MLPYLAILMPVLLLCCGIAVDVSLLQMHKLQMQSACDAAALGAEVEIERGNSSWVANAQADAGQNGFSSAGGAIVSVAMRPSTGSYAGFYDAIETTISQTQSTLFLKLLGSNAATLKTRSVAVVTPCVYLRNDGSNATYQLSVQTATISSTNCPIYVNGRASVSSGSSFSAMAENITGTAANSSWGVTPSAPPRYSANTLGDPLASITQPSATCTSNTNTSYPVNSNVTATASISCGNTSITCQSTSNVVTLAPGLYQFGGSFTVNKCTLSGSNVTFYFTKDANGSYGGFTLNNSIVNVSAPTTTSANGIAGVLVITDRSFQKSTAQDFVLNNTTMTGDGIWYLTGAGLALKTNSSLAATNYLGIVADNLVLSSGTSLTTDTDFSNMPGGNPFRPLGGLVE